MIEGRLAIKTCVLWMHHFDGNYLIIECTCNLTYYGAGLSGADYAAVLEFLPVV